MIGDHVLISILMAVEAFTIFRYTDSLSCQVHVCTTAL